MKTRSKHNMGHLGHLLLSVSLIGGLLGGMPSPLKAQILVPIRRQAQSRVAVVVQGSISPSDQYPLQTGLTRTKPILASQ